jgi:hypothetical protein
VGHVRLAKSDLDLRDEAGITEGTLDGVGGSHRSVEEESLVLHIRIGQNGVDRSPHDAARVEGLACVPSDLEPGACDTVAADRGPASRMKRCRLRTLAYEPGKARLVDTGSAAGRTVEVCVGSTRPPDMVQRRWDHLPPTFQTQQPKGRTNSSSALKCRRARF